MDTKPHFDEQTNARIQELMNLIVEVRFSDPDRDYQACKELLEISQRENYQYGIAYSYAYLGDCLIGKNESVSASTNLMQAKKLCEKHRFLDLLPYVCTWLGLYYEMQNDRQMAMQNYLDALEFAERNNDLMRQSILLNNIASQFQNCGNYEIAKEYYVKSFHCFYTLDSLNRSDPHYAQMTANIISVCCHLKQIDEAKYYYALLEKSEQLAENQNQLYLCNLLISTASGNLETIYKSVDNLLLEMQKQQHNHHQFFETFLVVADNMLKLKEENYSRKILTELSHMCHEGEYGHRLKVQYVWMDFYKMFGTAEEKNKAYKLFYELREMSDDILNRNLAEGLLSKIKLRESMKRNLEIKKAKEALEDVVQLDELTQLYNRRTLRILTEQVVSDPEVHTLAFLMIDVDYFKQYNDSYGHSMGDDALRAVADSLVRAGNKNIYSFRYGGDEFSAVCKNHTVEEIEAYIHKLTTILRDKHIPHKSSLSDSKELSLSIGYSVCAKPENSIADITKLMAQADKALYKAKALGRNCHCIYSGENSSSE